MSWAKIYSGKVTVDKLVGNFMKTPNHPHGFFSNIVLHPFYNFTHFFIPVDKFFWAMWIKLWNFNRNLKK